MANRYTDSFKRDMVRLASQGGTDITSLCKENGISRSTLYKWMSDYKPFHADTITLHEFETLKRQVETLRLENEIVKEHNFICQQKIHLCIIFYKNVYFLLTNIYLGQRLSKSIFPAQKTQRFDFPFRSRRTIHFV